MRFLLVDDDERILMLLEALLAPYAEITTAGGGPEAIKLFKQAFDENQPFTTVFMDINMPDMGGPETVDELRVIESRQAPAGSENFKLVMISAYGETMKLYNTIFKGQADATIEKPFTRSQLIDELSAKKIINDSES